MSIESLLAGFSPPFVFCAGHTMGYRFNGEMVPLIPPFIENADIGEAAKMLGVGDMPASTFAFAAKLAKGIPSSRLSILLNDTTHIPEDLERAPEQPNRHRAQLAERFSGESFLLFQNLFDGYLMHPVITKIIGIKEL